MATFKISYGHSVCRRYLTHAVKKTKLSCTTRQLTSFNNGKFRCKENFSPLLHVNGFNSLRITVYEVFYSSKSVNDKPLNLDSLVNYEKVAEETLQSMYDRFEELLQNSSFEDWDANYSNGVLTVTLKENCVYVINKQTPNRQIWLSSPVSGPKRYDYVNGTWIYKHDGFPLHQLLTDELCQLLQKDANFFTCTFSSKG